MAGRRNMQRGGRNFCCGVRREEKWEKISIVVGKKEKLGGQLLWSDEGREAGEKIFCSGEERKPSRWEEVGEVL